MAIAILKRSWTMKPQVASINWGHPLARGLVSYHLFGAGGGFPRDLVNGKPASYVGIAPTWAKGDRGMAMRSSADNTAIKLDHITNVGFPSGSITWRMNPPVSSAEAGNVTRKFWGCNKNGGPVGLNIQRFGNGDGSVYAGWTNAGDFRVYIPGPVEHFPANVWSSYVFTWSAAGSRLYRNGTLIGSNANAPNVGNAAQAFQWMEDPYPYSGYPGPKVGTLYDYGGIYRQALPQAAVRELHVNPYQFLSQRQRIYVPLVSGWDPKRSSMFLVTP